MNIDFDSMSPAQAYFHLTSTLVPRPIAWVLSENEQSGFNLAPFSYFTAVSSAPPLLMFSVGKHPDSRNKDTLINIEQRREFVVHIAGVDMATPLNASAEMLPPDESELDKLGLEVVEFEGFRLPRLADCHIAFACECYQMTEIGDTPQTMIFGRIKSLFIDDSILIDGAANSLQLDMKKLDPLSRLGAGEYASLGAVLALARPK